MRAGGEGVAREPNVVLHPHAGGFISGVPRGGPSTRRRSGSRRQPDQVSAGLSSRSATPLPREAAKPRDLQRDKHHIPAGWETARLRGVTGRRRDDRRLGTKRRPGTQRGVSMVNRQPRQLQALPPTGATGLEPATSGVTGRRSNRLSYAPNSSGLRSMTSPGRSRADHSTGGGPPAPSATGGPFPPSCAPTCSRAGLGGLWVRANLMPRRAASYTPKVLPRPPLRPAGAHPPQD